MVEYKGSRDPRFVAVHRGGQLDDVKHRLLASWAATCAEHVLSIFEQEHPNDARPRKAIETARRWSRGEATVGEARDAAFAAHDAARESSIKAARQAARSAGHAVATAHMADHELGAAAYAIEAARLAATDSKADEAAISECEWQRYQLMDAIRELVLFDQMQRNQKFKGVFTPQTSSSSTSSVSA